ncbi:DNA polymerase III subunit delta [Arsukibacterium sp.]|uniref:DNA polymerase III subunit delta n=1 Tax=Arsukibacterium sp. TaxID=1977258 RepID=UPI002FDA1504
MQKLYANQLEQHLQQGVAPCYLLFGEEPLQKLEALSAIRQAAKQQGYAERISLTADTQFDFAELFNELSAMSLFAERRLIELELAQTKPGAAVNEQLKKLAKTLTPDIILLVHGERSHAEVSKLSWFKQLEPHAVQVPIYPLDERLQRQWLQQRAKQLQLQLTSDASAMLLQHCAGNLLAARQELTKLQLSFEQQLIDADTLSGFLADHSSFNVFQLVDALLQGQGDEALHRLDRLLQQDTEPVMIAWQLQKEVLQLRQLQAAGNDINASFKQMAIWPKRQPLYRQALQRLSLRWLDYLLQELAAFDRLYKTGQLGQLPLALAHLCCLFCQRVPASFGLQQWQHD